MDSVGRTEPLNILERCGNRNDGGLEGDAWLEVVQAAVVPMGGVAMEMDVSKGLERGASKAQASQDPRQDRA